MIRVKVLFGFNAVKKDDRLFVQRLVRRRTSASRRFGLGYFVAGRSLWMW